MQPQIEVETGIAMPRGGSQSRYPFETMEVGQSFLFPEDVTASSANRACALARKQFDPKVFTARKVVENGVERRRAWRTA